ncbi:tyrosine-type recombinase/integrase [Bradyrhizobium yuanmingense]|uniref:site-specific integrase n=1 Tax=Bradyrhizobium yuanmingense TaxID=108015 RepID=UPI0012F8F963|nr:site-specific integrase [Bradyrhizobium yuanmingense]MVT52519.1 tyrosine-type recombinase/integrase [Bradyrhizobium yuanmingense]
MSSLQAIADAAVPAAIAPELAAAVAFAKAEKAPATRKAYGTDFRLFRAWCEEKRAEALPALPETVAAYLAHAAAKGTKASTLGRRLAAIRYAHKLANLPTPTDSEAVKATIRGIRRTIGSAKVRKAPAVVARLKAMVETCPDTLTGKRDRALLLLGFGGAFRRSELVALDVEHFEEVPEGLRAFIAKSKTDQEAQGATIAIARGSSMACPVAALLDWLDAAGITSGPVFRPINKAGTVGTVRLTDRSVANIVKAYASAAGLDEKQFSGHSLRRGFLTSAAAAGKSVFRMRDVSRHKSIETMSGYIQEAELFKDHAGAGLL